MENVRRLFNYITDICSNPDTETDYEMISWIDGDIIDRSLFRIQNKILTLPNQKAIENYSILIAEIIGAELSYFEKEYSDSDEADEEQIKFFKENAKSNNDKILFNQGVSGYVYYEEKNDEYYYTFRTPGQYHLILSQILYFVESIIGTFLLYDIKTEARINDKCDSYLDILKTSQVTHYYREVDKPSVKDESKNEQLKNIDLVRVSRNKKFESIFTQAQLATMFRLLRDNEVLSMNDTQLASLIISFAGGSHQKTRGFLGGVNAGHINMTLKTKDQASEIQNILQKIIVKIDEEKKDIIE